MLAGAIDPLEGSIVILAGSAVVLLGTYFGHGEKYFLVYRICVFILILTGIFALWVTSMLGGFGGSSGLSIWWGLLVLLYPIGWLFSIWGPDSPRWVLWIGALVGLWYLILPALMINLRGAGQLQDLGAAEIFMGVFGAVTIAGCIYRLRKRKVVVNE